MSNVVILNVGSELTTGYRVNTHAGFLGEQLLRLGHVVRRVELLPDEPAQIHKSINRALTDSDWIIVTGGLGPTEDDVTLDALAKTLHLKLRPHLPTVAKIKAALRSRGIPYLDRHGLQARVFTNARVWSNEAGFAPGQAIPCAAPSGKKIWVIVLPGPPNELKAIWNAHATCFIQKTFPSSLVIRETRCLIVSRPESWVAERIKDLDWLHPRCEIGVYSDLYGTRLILREKIPTGDRKSATHSPRTTAILARFDDEAVILAPHGVPSQILSRLLSQNARLATAESCTGGGVGRLLVSEPGMSQCYLGGVIAYNNALKKNLLAVPSRLLRRHGAVSQEVAQAMAEGIQKRTGADYAIAVTGIAGPAGGSKDKPVGLVHFAIAQKKDRAPIHFHRIFSGSREMIQEKAAHTALAIFYQRLVRPDTAILSGSRKKAGA